MARNRQRNRHDEMLPIEAKAEMARIRDEKAKQDINDNWLPGIVPVIEFVRVNDPTDTQLKAIGGKGTYQGPIRHTRGDASETKAERRKRRKRKRR